MQINKPSCSSSPSNLLNQQEHNYLIDQSLASITFKFNQSLHLDHNNNINSLLEPDDEDEEEYLDCEDNEEYFNHENDEEFTFMYLGENNTPIPADKASKNKDIHPIFPLFGQNLLSHEERKQLPINPQVDTVFVESHRVALSSTSDYDNIESMAMGPYCTWKKQPPKLSKKSNSTGFSKLWRLKDKVGRSNSDGRDAFVFLKKSVRTTVGGSSSKGNVGKRKGLKAENGKFPGHEVYLRKRAQGEEDRRRSYLPYRPEIMGFFTNVNGGLSKNVHPY